MKKITLILILLFVITFSWQGNAQLTEDFEAGITNLANATGNTVDFDIETTIVYGGTQSVKNGYTGSNLNILEQAVAMDLSTTNAPILDFWHIAKTEGTWDKCYVEISTDGGATYTELPAVSYVGSAASYAEDLYFDEDSYTDWAVTNVPVDNAWWKKERFELSAYKVANVKIRFRFTSDFSVSRAGWYIDNVTVFDPTCAVAESISVANITTTTADVSWTDNNGLTATDYEYVVQPMGTGVPTGAGTVATANPQPLTGLMASTQYEVYLRAVCGASDYSEWNKADFATSCDAFGSFTENFDATANGEVPLCWSNVVNSADAAASVDAQGGAIEFSNAADAAAELILVTPELTDLPLDTHRIRFSAQGDAGYVVQIGTMDSPTGTFTPVFGFALTNVMTDYSYSFEASTTDAYVAIKAVLPAVNNTIVLDNFNWEPIPSCVEPVSLNLSGITGNDVTISWTETGSATEWEYVIQAPGAGIPAAAGTSTMTNPVTDTSLSPVTDYEVYVRAVCGVADESIWIGPSTFTTPCVVISPPYTETFTTYVPNCWSEATNGDIASGPTGFGSSSWFPEEFAHVGTGFGAVNINLYTLGTSDWLISPQFDLSSGGYEVVLDVALTGYNNTTPGTFGSDDEVQLLYTEDGVTWNNLQTWNAGNEPVAGGETISVALASTGSNVQFALWGSEGVIDDPEDIEFHIDNFKVRIPPTCYEPFGIVVSNETLDGATFTWTENNNPAATTWDLYIVPTGDAAPNAASTPTINDDTTQNVVWAGGTASSTYDVYVRTDCGADNTNVSVWIGMTFSTLPANDNCADAIALTVGPYFATEMVVGTNAGATDSGVTNPACSFYQGGDVWYSVVVPTDGAVTIDSNNIGFTDSGMAVYSGVCGSLVEVECDDDDSDNGSMSRIELTGQTPGDTLLIRFFEYGNDSFGDFEISAINPNVVATNDLATVGFNYYPNPVTNSLTMTANENITSVRIFNMLGQEVRNEKLSTLEANIDMSNLSNGTYFVKAQVGTTVGTFKIIKK